MRQPDTSSATPEAPIAPQSSGPRVFSSRNTFRVALAAAAVAFSPSYTSSPHFQAQAEVGQSVEVEKTFREWLIASIMRDAKYKEVMDVIALDVDAFKKQYPDRYQYAATLAEHLKNKPEEFDAAFNEFIEKLKEAACHPENSATEQWCSSTMLKAICHSHCETLLENIRTHEKALKETERVNTASLSQKYKLLKEKRYAANRASVQ